MIIEYDENDKVIHYKGYNGFEFCRKHDNNGNVIYYKNSDGIEEWYEYDDNVNLIKKTTIEVYK